MRDRAVIGGELIKFCNQISLGNQHGGFIIEAERTHVQVGRTKRCQRMRLQAQAIVGFFGVGAAGIGVGEHELRVQYKRLGELINVHAGFEQGLVVRRLRVVDDKLVSAPGNVQLNSDVAVGGGGYGVE